MPFNEGLSAKDHGEELGRVLCHGLVSGALVRLSDMHTKPAAGHSALLSKLVILLPQLLVAEYLVSFANLLMCKPPPSRRVVANRGRN